MTTITHYPNGIVVETERTPAFVNTYARGFKTKEEANDWRDSYASTYPTQGYGTMVHVSQDQTNETYTVYATRYPSCD